jgi:pilus assembly protein Flp/PilA
MIRFITAWWKDEDGATAIEYALIAGIISIVIVASVVIISGALQGTYTTVSDSMA